MFQQVKKIAGVSSVYLSKRAIFLHICVYIPNALCHEESMVGDVEPINLSMTGFKLQAIEISV